MTNDLLIIAERVMHYKNYSGSSASLSDADIELISTLNKDVWPLARVKPILQFINENKEWFQFLQS